MGLAARAVAALAVVATAQAAAQTTITPSISGRVEYTNNVTLAPDDAREHDFVLTLTPSVSFNYRHPRVDVDGAFSVPLRVYARTDSENRADVQGFLRSRTEVVDEFFFVDASVNVMQSYLDPFGSRPGDLTSVTDNRFTTATFRVAPFIQGRLGGNITYLLRDDIYYSRYFDAGFSDNSTYSNRLTGTIERQASPFGWGVDIERSEYEYDDQRSEQLLERVRTRATWRPGADWFAYLTAGYERNRFPLTRYDGATYGAGVTWTPDGRTSLNASWEHRYFGESYSVNFRHRTPLTVWSVSASRDASSFPQLVAELPPGTFVPGILNELLIARIPDAAERVQFIIDYMSAKGLPVVLNDSLAIYTQRISVVERASASVGLLGVRNTVFLSLFYWETTPVTASGDELPPPLGFFTNNTQYGGSAAWSYQLAPLTSLSLSGTVTHTEAEPPFTGESTQRIARLSFNRRVSPRTSVFAGMRWQDFSSDFSAGWDEFAVFAGFNYSFR